jgi:hypothetical protein
MAFLMRDVFGNKCFLIQFANQAIVETSDGQKRSNISGEAVICFYGDHPTRFAVSLERFSLASSSVEGKKGATGIISVVGKSAEGILKFEDGNINLNIEIKCKINYESLDRELVSGIDKGDYYIPAFEPAVAHISGNLIKDKDSLVLASFKLNVVAAAGRFGEIQLITFEMDSIPLFSFPNIQAKFRESREEDSTNTDTKSNNTDSNICISVTRRQITVQPVGFRSSASDPNPSGSTAITQLNTARSIWGKCCIDIQINPINLITNATLKTSSDLVAIRDSYTHVDPNIIEIFL